MKLSFKFILSVLFLLNFQNLYAQVISNLKIETNDVSITLTYDLESAVPCNVALYYSDDSTLKWKGPLQKVTGDIGLNQLGGKQKKIIWAVSEEIGSLEGLFKFKIVATQSKIEQFESDIKLIGKNSDNANNYQKNLKIMHRKRNMWLIPMALSASVGGYSYFQTGILYEKYKIATLDAAKIRGQVQTMAVIYPIAFAATGFSVLEFIINNRKISKEKNKKISMTPIYHKGTFSMNMLVKL